MSEHLHPHDEQWDDMPLPNEEEAWLKMKRLLDIEDRRRRLLPFWFWRYALLGLLLVGTAAGGYFLLNQDRDQIAASALNKETDRQQNEVEQTTVRNKKRKENGPLQIVPITTKEEIKTNTEKKVSQIPVQDHVTVTTKVKKAPLRNRIPVRKPGRNTIANFSIAEPMTGSIRKKHPSQEKHLPELKQSTPSDAVPAHNRMGGKEYGTGIVTETAHPTSDPVPRSSETKADRLKPIITKAVKDSVATADSIKMMVTTPVVRKVKPEKENRILLSYGIGLQQAIAFNGLRPPTHDSTGKKIGWFNYMPSLYLRLEKEKWFLQAEFHYRAPQVVNPVSYHQTTSYDSANALVRTERFSVHKLYYRQILFSIHRFVLPNWSWGMGGAYNLLAGAVVEQQTEDKNIINGGATVWRRPFAVKGYNDSFLCKSTAGILLQTDYHWRRLSVGLRYTKNLQPFIKYTRPDGTVLEEKNQMLQAVLRFRIKG